MKILLACSAGMSTSILENSIKKYAKSINQEVEVIALPSNEARECIDQYDIVLLGPQVKFLLDSFTEAAEGIPVVVVPPQIYALANGKACYELILKNLHK